MDLKAIKKLEVQAKVLKKNLGIRTTYPLRNDQSLSAEFQNLLYVAQTALPSNQKLYDVAYRDAKEGKLSVGGAFDILVHLLQLIKEEEKKSAKNLPGSIFGDIITHPLIQQTSKDHLKNGAYRTAVLDAMIKLEVMIK